MISVARRAKDRCAVVDSGKTRVGPYRLCVELATGGMSIVYLACKEGTPGVVALKLISPELTGDPTYLDMFVDETDIASRIRHPNVCKVFDFDRAGSDCYIAMEYILGEPASAMRAKIVRRKSHVERDARLVARFLSDVCEGLHAAHELCNDDGEPLDVVHRDISPENLFLTYEGVAKVVDFGLVNSSTQHHRTRTGLLKGKFAYIAPEILNGKRPDRRADVWGLGLVAWELLTGKRLFRRKTEVETLRAVMEGEIPPPSEVRAGIPKALDDIVLKALERKPKDRYATALELGKELLRVSASGEEVTSAGDLARWMDELFPAGAERRRNLIDLALQFDASESEAPPPRLERSSSSSFPPAPADLSTMATIALDRSAIDRTSSCSTPRPAVRDVPPSPARPSSRWMLFAALGIGCLVGSLATQGISLFAKPAIAAPVRAAPAGQPPSANQPTLSTANVVEEPGEPAESPVLVSTAPEPTAPAAVPGSFVVSGPVVIEIAGDPSSPVLSIRPK